MAVLTSCWLAQMLLHHAVSVRVQLSTRSLSRACHAQLLNTAVGVVTKTHPALIVAIAHEQCFGGMVGRLLVLHGESSTDMPPYYSLYLD
jgi:predicted anti-sigma-YlaC factor YlaD